MEPFCTFTTFKSKLRGKDRERGREEGGWGERDRKERAGQSRAGKGIEGEGRGEEKLETLCKQRHRKERQVQCDPTVLIMNECGTKHPFLVREEKHENVIQGPGA